MLTPGRRYNTWFNTLHKVVIVYCSPLPQTAISASPEKLSEIQIFRPHSRMIEPNTRGGWNPALSPFYPKRNRSSNKVNTNVELLLSYYRWWLKRGPEGRTAAVAQRQWPACSVWGTMLNTMKLELLHWAGDGAGRDGGQKQGFIFFPRGSEKPLKYSSRNELRTQSPLYSAST